MAKQSTPLDPGSMRHAVLVLGDDDQHALGFVEDDKPRPPSFVFSSKFVSQLNFSSKFVSQLIAPAFFS